jgi:hypothetical protein
MCRQSGNLFHPGIPPRFRCTGSVITNRRRKTVVPFQEYKNRLIDYLQTHPMRMTWTCFSPGVFLDYYSPSTLGGDYKGKLASSETLWPAGFTFIVDFDQKLAEVPGDGDTGRIAQTAADDIGGFVAAASTQLPLSQWPVGEWGICGGLYTPNEIVSVAKKVRGIVLENMAHCRTFTHGIYLPRDNSLYV